MEINRLIVVLKKKSRSKLPESSPHFYKMFYLVTIKTMGKIGKGIQ